MRMGMMAVAASATLIMPGCATTTMVGPTVQVMPGRGQSLAAQQADHRACMAQTTAEVQPAADRLSAAAVSQGFLHASGPTIPAQVQPMFDQGYGGCMASRGYQVGRMPAYQAGGIPAQDTTARPQASAMSDRAGILAAAGFKVRGQQVMLDKCEGPLRPALSTLHLGGAVGDATLVSTEDSLCFGSSGAQQTILRRTGSGWTQVFDNSGATVEVRPTRHGGVADIVITGSGMVVGVQRWDGTRYVFWKTETIR